MLKHLFRFFLLLFLSMTFVIPAVVHAQVELNVKAKKGSNASLILWMNRNDPPPSLRMVMIGAGALNQARNIRALKDRSTTKKESTLDEIYSFRLDRGDKDSLIQALRASGDFEWVEENRGVALHGANPSVPPMYPKTHALDTGIASQWYHPFIQTFEAWDSTQGDPSVLIGILDTGLDYEHPEFDGQVAINAAEDANRNGRFDPWPDTVLVAGVPGDFDGIDADQNGYTDDVIGYDFTDQPRSPFGGDYLFEDPDPMDDNDHGTLVAGIISALPENGQGGAGIAPGCKLKVLRAFGANGAGEDDDIARAVIYAADNGIHILNFSFGDIYPSQMMHAAIQYAEARGVIMVASAGNGTGDQIHYPSNFNEVIAVSASALSSDSTTEFLWPLSSFGLTVSLCAPGSNIFTTVVQDTALDTPYDFFSGTSTAAPMVAAATGLLLSQRGSCSPQQIRGILTSTADDISNPGWDHLTGAGRLNILRALQAPGASNVQILSPENDAGSAGDTVYIVGTVLDPEFSAMTLEYEAGTDGNDNWIPIREGMTRQVLAETLATWVITTLPDGEYTLRLRVDKTNGSTAEDRIRFVIDRTVPAIDLRVAAPAWDNFERKMLFVFRNSDRGVTRIHYRPLGGSNYLEQVFDRTTRNGRFILGTEALNDGAYQFYISSINEAGLMAQTAVDTFVYSSDVIPLNGYDTLAWTLPMGRYLEDTYDFDGDGLREIVMSRYSEQLGFGKLMTYEFNASEFVAVDSLDFKPILIPKDVADANGNGRLELLCSVNDSTYIVEQSASNTYPSEIIYTNHNNGLFPARFGNTDADNDLELLIKDFVDYRVFDRSGGNNWTQTEILEDETGSYIGSVAPRVLVDDFDGDGQNEVVYGDFDGDFIVYEFDGANYQRTFIDSTLLTKSGPYLTAGDYDGDGQQEFLVAVHASLNRNEIDFEYEPAYWHLRIFKSMANDDYSMVWEDYLFDIDTDDFNASTAANIDQDPADELIFTTFPRTYIVDYDGSDYQMRWFHYGDLTTHHAIGDFNNNGVNEFAIGRGDTAFFWELEFNYTGPQPVTLLEGNVQDSQSVNLYWDASPNATDYRIWRGEVNGPGSILIGLVDSTSQNSYLDNNLINGQDYLYVLESKNAALSPIYSGFSNAVLLRPHPRGLVDSVVAIREDQALVYFSVPVRAIPEDKARFILNGAQTPNAIVSSGDTNNRVVLSFTDPFITGTNMLEIDSAFQDLFAGFFESSSLLQAFTYQPDTTQFAWFTGWEILAPEQALIRFNTPMTASVLDATRYRMTPAGRVTNVEWENSNQDAIIVTVADAALGALGYPLSIILESGDAQNGGKMRAKEGNIATFSDFKPDLSQVYVYPNPYRAHEFFQGIRFANLTRTATVHVYSASGRKVITLQENDGDGGLDWNLINAWGERIKPGTYLFRVEAPEQEEVIGKFSILE